MIKNVYWSLCKVPVNSCQILSRLEFSLQVFEKYSNIKFQENLSSASRVAPYGQTETNDEANNHFSQSGERA
jgi:hypothetical protein